MKRLNFDNVNAIRYMCTKGEVNRIILEGKKHEVIGVTPKGIIVEFKTENK